MVWASLLAVFSMYLALFSLLCLACSLFSHCLVYGAGAFFIVLSMILAWFCHSFVDGLSIVSACLFMVLSFGWLVFFLACLLFRLVC